MESHRLGSVLVSSQSVSPGAVNSCIPQGPYPTPASVDAVVFDAGPSAFVDAGYDGGWFNCFHTASNRLSGIIGLMEAHDDARALALITRIAFTELATDVTPVTLHGLPDATVVRFVSGGEETVAGFVPHGRVISYGWVGANHVGAGQLGAVVALLTGILTAQKPRSATFEPTAPSEIGMLDDDPDQLAAKTYHPPGPITAYQGGYPASYYAAMAWDPVAETPLLTSGGFTEMYRTETEASRGALRGVSLYRFRDAGGAAAYYRGVVPIIRRVEGSHLTIVSLPGAKNTTCYAVTFSAGNVINQECIFPAGRYVVVADAFGLERSASDFTAMHPIIAAQLSKTPR